MVLCPFHRSHREICTRNRPVSETKFLDDFWGPLSLPAPLIGNFLRAGTLTRGDDISRVIRDDGMVTLCALRAATVLSRKCCADFGRPLTKKDDVALA